MNVYRSEDYSLLVCWVKKANNWYNVSMKILIRIRIHCMQIFFKSILQHDIVVLRLPAARETFKNKKFKQIFASHYCQLKRNWKRKKMKVYRVTAFSIILVLNSLFVVCCCFFPSQKTSTANSNLYNLYRDIYCFVVETNFCV